MLGREEILRSLTAAWRLFLNQPDAMRLFDTSLDGFWRSFGAIGLIAPCYLLTAIADGQAGLPADVSGATYLLDKALTLCLDWITLPILLAALARPLAVTRSYPAFIVARNWATVITILPFAAVALLTLFGFIDADAANLISLALLIVVFRYNFIIARRALGAGIGLAVGLVALDFVVSLAITEGIDSIFGV